LAASRSRPPVDLLWLFLVLFIYLFNFLFSHSAGIEAAYAVAASGPCVLPCVVAVLCVVCDISGCNASVSLASLQLVRACGRRSSSAARGWRELVALPLQRCRFAPFKYVLAILGQRGSTHEATAPALRSLRRHGCPHNSHQPPRTPARLRFLFFFVAFPTDRLLDTCNRLKPDANRELPAGRP